MRTKPSNEFEPRAGVGENGVGWGKRGETKGGVSVHVVCKLYSSLNLPNLRTTTFSSVCVSAAVVLMRHPHQQHACTPDMDNHESICHRRRLDLHEDWDRAS